ncbi:hypothetical protein EV426DRAFT_704391 [Tirmania nivea]|nr:hypothetical protein EV426DRAFT_704391 [Tirmania nivea]
MERPSVEWGRWVCGGWRGSARMKIEDWNPGPENMDADEKDSVGGIGIWESTTSTKGDRGSGGTMGREINVAELNVGEVTAWSDGSRQDEVKAVAAVGGEAGEGWEEGAGRSVVALDSQGAIGRLRNLCFEQPRSWIEEPAVEEMRSGSKTVMWVKGHSAVEGNERADRKAKEVAWVGTDDARYKHIVLTEGNMLITNIFLYHKKLSKHPTDLPHGTTFQADEMEPISAMGVDRWWLHKIGSANDPWCGLCEEGVAQNRTHLLSCPGVADGKGRKWEQIWEDPGWCEKLAGAVRGSFKIEVVGSILSRVGSAACKKGTTFRGPMARVHSEWQPFGLVKWDMGWSTSSDDASSNENAGKASTREGPLLSIILLLLCPNATTWVPVHWNNIATNPDHGYIRTCAIFVVARKV